MTTSLETRNGETVTITTDGGPITIDVGDSQVVTLRLEVGTCSHGSYISKTTR